MMKPDSRDFEALTHECEELRKRVEVLARANSLLTSVVEDQDEFVVRWLPDGTRTFVNGSYCRYYGGAREEMIGTSFFPLISDGDRERVLARIGRLAPEAPVSTGEHRVVRPDGSIGWNRWTDRAKFDDEGRVLEIQSVGTDITAQKADDRALRESKFRYQRLAEASFEGIAITHEGVIVDATPMLADMFGYELSSVVGRDALDLVAPESRALVAERLRGGVEGAYEHMALRRDGSVFPVEVHGRFLTIDGRKIRVTGIQDITDRWRTERALRESEATYRLLVETAPYGIFQLDSKGGLLSVNPAGMRIMGLETPVGGTPEVSYLDTVPAEDRSRIAAHLEESLTGGKSDFEHGSSRGSVLQTTIVPVVEAGGSIRRLMGIIHDISHRVQAEMALRVGEERLKLATAATGLGTFDWNLRDEDLHWDERMKEIMGFTPRTGVGPREHFAHVIHPDDRERFDGWLAAFLDPNSTKTTFQEEFRIRIGDQVRHIVTQGIGFRDASGSVVRITGSNLDVSERKESEVALQQALREIRELKDRLQAENTYLQQEIASESQFGDIVGRSRALQETLRQIELVAPTDSTVLILGESGTGKELVAREIHRHSTRSGRSMIRVNCATIPKDLYESEFFGHVKGAFTGAVRDHAGRFQLADGGTLFLDEVGEIPMELQSKLLRVLQENQFERVGGEITHTTDVRLIAATNGDLARAVREGRFREDLYYRLNVFPVTVAPLRERIEDIGELARHFTHTIAGRLKVPAPGVTLGDIARLQEYDWPGNVRELRNVIERAIITSRDGALNLALPDRRVREPEPAAVVPVLSEAEIRRRERDNILAALRLTKWKIYGPGGAAELMGVKPTTLAARVERMGLRKDDDLR